MFVTLYYSLEDGQRFQNAVAAALTAKAQERRKPQGQRSEGEKRSRRSTPRTSNFSRSIDNGRA